MWITIANHLWQSTLFVLLIGALCHLLRHDGAHVRYWLWWAASVKFLLPFSLLTALGARFADWAALAPVPELWSSTMTSVANPFTATEASWSIGAVVLAAWLAGTGLVLTNWIVRAAKLRRVVESATQDSAPLRAAGQWISVYRADARVEPGVIGILRTALLLPNGIEKRLTPAQLEAVLAHELCHIRRRDNLTAAVHMLVEAVFWFHPLVWWVGAKLIDERERACDEMVVQLGHDRETYAESILDVCEQFVASPLRCAAGISGSDLKRRITQIMRYQGMSKLNAKKRFLLSGTAIGALAIPLLAGFVMQNVATAQDPGAGSAEEYLPIVKVAPIYPPQAAAERLEGEVVLSYTITAEGSTDNIVVVESTSPVFEQPALDSAAKYKYRPRLIDGQPVAVDGVRVKIIFALEDDSDTSGE